MPPTTSSTNHLVTEERLQRLLATNHVQGLSDLYDYYAPAVYGIILKSNPDSAKACDILFHVFTQFAKQYVLTKGKHERLFLSLYKITKQLAA
jgi:hypothetical protein